MTEQQRYNNLYNSLLIDNKLIHVGHLLERAAKKWHDRKTVICDGESITYKELLWYSYLMSKKLTQNGVKANDRVIIFYENSIEFFIAYFGIWQTGAIVVPLNVFLSKNELTGIIKNSDPKALIISPKLLNKLNDDEKESLPPIITEIDKQTPIQDIENLEIINRNLDDTAAILYTSGTTGFPKGVMLTSRNIITNTIQGLARFETEENERVYCALPLFHSLPQNTCVWANVVLGSTAIIVPRIDRKSLLNGFKHRPTAVVSVPAIYGLFCKMRSIDFGPVKYFISGGDALTDKVRSYFSLLYRRKICNGYGLTETSPFVSLDIDDYTQPTSNVGKPFIGVQISIRDKDENELKNGEIGILWIKGKNIMKGYYNSPEATAAVIKDGWFNTGDLAYIDNNGKIVITGREKDLIISKGINIYPQEIENILLSHKEIFQAGVIGIKKDDDEIPIAFVAGNIKDEEKIKKELLDLCKQSLASYKIPKKFIIKKELPITATGKVDKIKIKSELTGNQ